MEHQIITATDKVRSGDHGVHKPNSHELFQQQEFHKLLITPPENGNSFTALLELPPTQAMQLLTDNINIINTNINDDNDDEVVKLHRISGFNHSLSTLPAFPSNRALVERAAKYSIFATHEVKVKPEPLDFKSNGNDNGNGNPNLSDPTAGSDCDKDKPLKRKEREKKGKGSSKKSKTTSLDDDADGEKLPYVHVRARRGQATDSHSLAERARREKINARMKLLQELVPGCNKISGTALVLDEIINHVQYLQRQVEYLSMRLAAVNPRIDFNLDSLISGNDSMMDCNFMTVPTPLMWPEVHLDGDRQQFQQQWHAESLTQPVWIKEEHQRNLVASDNSLMTYNSPTNSASLHSSQLKMEL